MLTLKCTSHGGMCGGHLFGNISIMSNSECCNADFWSVRRLIRLEISRCRSESILMKVSDIIVYIMKIM